MQDRRNDNRLLCAELVELIYRDGSGRQRHAIVNLEDISLAGACLQTETRVPDETRVRIRYSGGDLVGKVRYCAYREASYFLGIQFEEGCTWSEKKAKPEHLFDPRQLVERVLGRMGESGQAR